MTVRHVARTLPAPARDPVGGLEAGGTLWTRGDVGLVGAGVAAHVEVGLGNRRFEEAAQRLGELWSSVELHDAVGLPGCGPVAFASFSFEPDAPGSVLVVPASVRGRRHDHGWETRIAADRGEVARAGGAIPAPAGAADAPGDDGDRRIRYGGSTLPDVAWLDAVATAVARIGAGGLDKVVLARDQLVWSRTPFHPQPLAATLAARFPECFTFCVDGLVGATPELLVRRIGPAVNSLVLAGTTGRSTDPAEDAALGERLLASEKDRAEHAFGVTSVVEVLEGYCSELAVDPEPHLLQLANVQHLATAVHGTLADGPRPTALELAGALHPTAAVCGTPRAEALALIGDLEGMDRGRYAGPVGWVDARGDGEFGIALRCAQLDGARARLFAGAGIVAGSLPEAELEETRLKLRAMQAAFGGAP